MSAVQTRVPQVIDALLAGMRALTGYRAPTDTAVAVGARTVYDSGEIRTTDDITDSDFLIIGWGGADADSLEASATVTLAPGPIAATNRPRDEISNINVMIFSQRGESAKLARDGAFTTLNDLAAFCRSDPSLGIDTSGTIGGIRTSAWVTTGSLTQYLQDGFIAQLGCTVSFASRV